MTLTAGCSDSEERENPESEEQRCEGGIDPSRTRPSSERNEAKAKEMDQISVLLDALQEDHKDESSTASGPSMEPDVASEPSSSNDPSSQKFAVEEGLLGSWSDSYGNLVSVYQTGPSAANLTATFSKAGKQDIHFGLWQEPEEGIWHCGDATLDLSSCSAESVSWKFWNGRVSVWTRQASCYMNGSFCGQWGCGAMPGAVMPPANLGVANMSGPIMYMPVVFEWKPRLAFVVNGP